MLNWFQKFYDYKQKSKEKHEESNSLAFVDIHFYYRKADSECSPSGILVKPSNKIYEESEFL